MKDLLFINLSNDISTSDWLSLLEGTGSECPADIASQTGNVHTLGDVDITSALENTLERTLDTIENGVHDTRAQFDGKRLFLTEDGISNSKSTSILVDLNRGGVAFQLNDLSDQLGVSNTDQLVHGSSTHVVSDNQRSRDLEDKSIVRFFLSFHIAHGAGLVLIVLVVVVVVYRGVDNK